MSKARERRQVAQVAPEQVTGWGRMLWAPGCLSGQGSMCMPASSAGGQHVEGAQHLEPAYGRQTAAESLQSRAKRW